MKKTFKFAALLLALILVSSLSGCVRVDEPTGRIESQSLNPDNTIKESYTLEPSNLTLTYNNVIYRYSFSRDGADTSYTITYPNGASYYSTRGEGTNTAGWSNDYDPVNYAEGEKLVDILNRYYGATIENPGIANIVGAILCLAIGAFDAFFPEAAWYFAHMFRSWQYESVEPSEAGLTWTRVGGVIIIIMGVILFFSNWS